MTTTISQLNITPIKFTINDLIVDPVSLSENFNCPICEECIMDVNKCEALQCKEGHVHCRLCWMKSLESKKECMTCRTRVNSVDSLSKNIYLQKEFRNKKIFCPNLFRILNSGKIEIDEKFGCKEILKVDELEGHIKECQFQFIECPNDKECKTRLRKNQLKDHEEKCKKLKSECEFCGEKGLVIDDSKVHYSECEKFPIKCPQNCNSPTFNCTIERGRIKYHIENECPFTVIQCKYREAGCMLEFPRSELSEHMKLIDHSKYMEATIDQHICKFEKSEKEYKKLELEYNRLKDDFKILQSELKVIRELKFNYQNKWVITNWSQKLQDYPKPKSIESPEFMVGNLKFKIQFYPNGGLSDESKDFLSIYLYKFDDQTPSKVQFSFELLNKDFTRNRKLASTNIFHTENKWGWRSFINNSLVTTQTGFVIQNSVTLNINIEILPEEKEAFTS
ncbi:hypothetical protein ACTFIW_011443 [Dictyostelium discoideum]